jgi:hypothetical protein
LKSLRRLSNAPDVRQQQTQMTGAQEHNEEQSDAAQLLMAD